MVRAESLTKRFGGISAVDDLSFALERGSSRRSSDRTGAGNERPGRTNTPRRRRAADGNETMTHVASVRRM